MEIHETASEPRDVPRTIRLTQSFADAVDALAALEDRKPADMLRILAQDGYKVRVVDHA